MSYDVHFLRVSNGESLEDAYERLEEDEQEEAQAQAPTQADRDVWEHIATSVLHELPSPERFDGDAFLQIMDMSLGLDLTLGAGPSADLSISYWHEGEAAETALEVVTRCVRLVQEATGLVAFDPQTGGAFLHVDEEGNDARHEILAGGTAALRQVMRESRPKRWWQFWR